MQRTKRLKCQHFYCFWFVPTSDLSFKKNYYLKKKLFFFRLVCMHKSLQFVFEWKMKKFVWVTGFKKYLTSLIHTHWSLHMLLVRTSSFCSLFCAISPHEFHSEHMSVYTLLQMFINVHEKWIAFRLPPPELVWCGRQNRQNIYTPNVYQSAIVAHLRFIFSSIFPLIRRLSFDLHA